MRIRVPERGSEGARGRGREREIVFAMEWLHASYLTMLNGTERKETK
jgi:hypothetical protein